MAVPHSSVMTRVVDLGSNDLGNWDELRAYLSYVRELEVAPCNETMCQLVQSHFVEQRQRDATTTTDAVHLWLNLVRLIAATFGDQEITPEHWQMVCTLERWRLASIAQLPAPSQQGS